MTLALTINADGSAGHELVGASPFPRHWIYDDSGELVRKSSTVDFKTWYREAHGQRTSWGDEESEAVVAAAESAFERELSRELMTGGATAGRKRLQAAEPLVQQGEPGSDVYLLLDGILTVEVDGEPVAELGPGTIAGERSALEGGRRTAILRARTACNVAVVPANALPTGDLEALAAGRRRGGGVGRSPRSPLPSRSRSGTVPASWRRRTSRTSQRQPQAATADGLPTGLAWTGP